MNHLAGAVSNPQPGLSDSLNQWTNGFVCWLAG